MHYIPIPPFLGYRHIDQLSPASVIAYLNRKMLFQFHWQMKGKETQAEEIFHRLLQESRQLNNLQLKASYGYFPCQSEGDSLFIYTDSEAREIFTEFQFPRQSSEKKSCLADYFQSKNSGVLDVVAFQLVTIGQAASDFEKKLHEENRYQDYLFWHGFHASMAEALAEFIHSRIRVELGFAKEEPADPREMIKQHYHGARYSLGYPSCPNLSDQSKVLKLLYGHDIGVDISESFQFWPEHSTSAMVVHHADAEYFLM